MTVLLFHEDSYRTSFIATVTARKGNQVVLDQTAFYAEAGGQNADQGFFVWEDQRIPVTDVQKADGQVWHTLTGDIVPEVGAYVHGEVDWSLRYQHMQRHSGEHLLAQAFLRVNPEFKVQAVSMRSHECTLDLSGNPTEEDARTAEQVIMRSIYRNLPFQTTWVTGAELKQYPLRRPPQVEGRIRLVCVMDRMDRTGYWEVSACGGTHVNRTGEVGAVFITKLEKVAGGLTRVFFVTGHEAYQLLTQIYRDARTLASSFSTSVEKLAERVEGLRTEALEKGRKLNAAYEALSESLLSGKSGVQVVPLADSEMLKPFSKVATAQPDLLCVAYTPDGRVVVTSSTKASAKEVLAEILKNAQGKGGGKPDLAQGSAPFEFLERAIHLWREGATT
ncbi:alanyl-tRNA editing protein [Deinococcus roseus]|uniref:Serine-tRNA(Ala) deacylase n=1 Tax=Deinococcus roseus TaxID=392414 RepID=A0ABQ2DCN3_9DEIO|nr:alanyl-tRNA editing protein [Deinococcus roseus]GGJ51223.1 serine-tRNA(Ala) deacylase [Deinococcus roseus]